MTNENDESYIFTDDELKFCETFNAHLKTIIILDSSLKSGKCDEEDKKQINEILQKIRHKIEEFVDHIKELESYK